MLRCLVSLWPRPRVTWCDDSAPSVPTASVDTHNTSRVLFLLEITLEWLLFPGLEQELVGVIPVCWENLLIEASLAVSGVQCLAGTFPRWLWRGT